MRRSSAGFTLLEILVAIAIASLLVTSAVQIYVQIQQSQQRGIEQNARDRVAELALDRIERELVGTVLVVRPKETALEEHPWAFIGFDGVREAHDADAVLFVTENPATTAGSLELEDARLVSYQIGAGELPEQLSVFRSETRLPDKLTRELPPPEGAPVIEGVAQFGITFRDEQSGAESPGWDSTAGAQANKLPGAVELKLQLYSEAPDGTQVEGQTFTRLVTLPVRPIGGDGEGEDTDCKGAPTVAECFKGLGLDTANLDQVLEGIGVKGSDCFKSDDPKLQTVLFSLRGTVPDPSELCK
jgi:type II secretion system protein J